MSTRLGAGLLVLLLGSVLGSASALADPVTVEAERCPQVDASVLSRAVDRELALAASEEVAPGAPESLAVVVTCPDGVHAQLSVAAPGGRAPLARELDLSEEPAGLQTKLLALAIAELIAELRVTAAPPGSRSVPSYTDAELPTFVRASAAPRVAPASITVRGGIRLIAGGPPMPTVSAELDVGRLRVGLVAALGDAHRDGMPYFIGATVSRPLVCSKRTTSLCLVARGELGFEGTSPHLRRSAGDGDDMAPPSVYAMYADLTLGFEARRRIAGIGWVASIDLGTGDGLVFESTDLERLDGPFAVTTLGASW